LIFPFQLRGGTARMPLLIALFAFTFNLVNGYLNGRYLFQIGPHYPPEWLLDPRFIVGALLFAGGYIINRHADATLMRLRDSGEPGYKIPHGGLYRFISCPNYFGEVIEWSGWALATWSLPGLAFAVWTVANLVPRARSHHRWYRETFPDYPRERRAVIPFLL
jgi:steroid 5-alpha-reductase/3-oxo-5-alpha-steroid 4-dehydrogenase 1